MKEKTELNQLQARIENAIQTIISDYHDSCPDLPVSDIIIECSRILKRENGKLKHVKTIITDIKVLNHYTD